MMVIGRVTQAAEVEARAVVENAARVCVCAESPFAMIFTHSRIPALVQSDGDR